jgi:hypothetical protein
MAAPALHEDAVTDLVVVETYERAVQEIACRRAAKHDIETNICTYTESMAEEAREKLAWLKKKLGRLRKNLVSLTPSQEKLMQQRRVPGTRSFLLKIVGDSDLRSYGALGEPSKFLCGVRTFASSFEDKTGVDRNTAHPRYLVQKCGYIYVESGEEGRAWKDLILEICNASSLKALHGIVDKYYDRVYTPATKSARKRAARAAKKEAAAKEELSQEASKEVLIENVQEFLETCASRVEHAQKAFDDVITYAKVDCCDDGTEYGKEENDIVVESILGGIEDKITETENQFDTLKENTPLFSELKCKARDLLTLFKEFESKQRNKLAYIDGGCYFTGDEDEMHSLSFLDKIAEP